MIRYETHRADATIFSKLSPEAIHQLREAAVEAQTSEDELIALAVENAFSPVIDLTDEDAEAQLALAEADAGGPLVPGVDTPAWLRNRVLGSRAKPPKATIYV